MEDFLSLNTTGGTSPFFEASKIDSIHFSIAPFDKMNWNKTVTKSWIYMMNEENNLPNQGWKIHLTAKLDEAQELLFDVSRILIKENISFKYIPDLKELGKRNSKYADRSEAGKFITIYPTDYDEFLRLLDSLSKLTKTFSLGPYILNDQQWHSSNVFFRYGAFKEITFEKDGHSVEAIYTPNGDKIPDQREPYFVLPPFVEESEELLSGVDDIEPSEFADLMKYDIKDVLHFSDAGGVYKADRNEKEFILKEGRMEAGLDNNGTDGFHRIQHEYRVLKMLKNVKGVVNVHDYFKSWINCYLVEDQVSGVTLDDFIASEFPFMGEKNVGCRFLRIIS